VIDDEEYSMKDIYKFDTDAILDNGLFWNGLWDWFYDCFDNGREYIIIDLSNVKIIKPEVLPKLCNMALIGKEQGMKIELNINPVSRLKDFLEVINFFDIAAKYQLFVLNEGQIGGDVEKNKATNAFLCFERNKLLKKYENKIIFEDDINEELKLKYCIEAEIFGIEYLFTPGYINDEMINKSPVLKVLSQVCDKDVQKRNTSLSELGLDFVELIHNSVLYGETPCFFAVQAAAYNKNNYYKTQFDRIDICVSDSGNGIYESLIKKDWKVAGKDTKTIPLEEFRSLTDEKKKNYYSILEMIYYRAGDGDRGVYDVMRNLANKKWLSVNIVNSNWGLNFNKDGLTEILNPNNRNWGNVLNGNRLLNKNNKGIISIKDYKPINHGFSMDISLNI
jgi:hypothetical protein